MLKFLCWLEIHNWKWSQPIKIEGKQGFWVGCEYIERKCKRCGCIEKRIL